jgi:hypothetical protein
VTFDLAGQTFNFWGHLPFRTIVYLRPDKVTRRPGMVYSSRGQLGEEAVARCCGRPARGVPTALKDNRTCHQGRLR